MDVKKIGGFLLTAGIVAVVFYMRMGERQEQRDNATTMAKAMIVQVDGYSADKEWYDSRSEIVIDSAFSASTSMERVGRRRRSVFHEEEFLPHFFEKLIAMAQDEAKSEHVKALIALRDQNGIPRPSDM